LPELCGKSCGGHFDVRRPIQAGESLEIGQVESLTSRHSPAIVFDEMIAKTDFSD
jgi:hypothetical protein